MSSAFCPEAPQESLRSGSKHQRAVLGQPWCPVCGQPPPSQLPAEALTRPWVPLSFLTSPKGTLRGLWTRCPSPSPKSLGLGVCRAGHPVQAWTPGRKPPSCPAPGPTCASREEPKSGVRFHHHPDTARSEVRMRGGGAQEVRRRPPGGLSGGGSGSSRPEGRAIWQGAALQLGAGHGIGGQDEGGKPAVGSCRPAWWPRPQCLPLRPEAGAAGGTCALVTRSPELQAGRGWRPSDGRPAALPVGPRVGHPALVCSEK